MTGQSRAIRTLALPEIETLVDWAADEGWNPGLADAAAFQAADPGGFIGAFVDATMVAGISAVAYGEDFGFIGLYICRPDSRGKGHGKAVWDAGMARLAGRTIGLDGVDEQADNYRGKGFVAAYRTIRFSGRIAPAAQAGAIRRVTPELMSGINDFDRDVFAALRPAFLGRWLAPPHLAMAAVDDGRVTGYGVLRACRDGWKLGGLFAASESLAIALSRALAAQVGGTIHIDVPAHQAGFIRHLQADGLTPGFETTRMYLGQPLAPSPAVFATTTLELG